MEDCYIMHFGEIKEKIKDKVIGIAGCGGLGSNCAVSLVRVGIIRLIIADFDCIEESNLNRQHYFINQVGRKKVYALKDNLMAVNPNVSVDAFDIRLTPDLILKIYKDCDIIVEAFDDAEDKKMIIETILDKMPDKPVVSGIGLAGWGDNNSIHTSQYGNLYICGDNIKEVNEDNPPLAPRVGIVANMQANQVLEILLKERT
ncbi:MAG: sulfur carrier protein ThiS adenylyltransferase ThiF [Bacteroidetes bacterium]|nr:sulfur carrier protein ThiS adenylyltransferase ThiF [Bacteroidota bacterium]